MSKRLKPCIFGHFFVPCNQQVGGSIPLASSTKSGRNAHFMRVFEIFRKLAFFVVFTVFCPKKQKSCVKSCVKFYNINYYIIYSHLLLTWSCQYVYKYSVLSQLLRVLTYIFVQDKDD